MVIIFGYIPMVQSLFLSFQTGKGVNLKFSGLQNYIRLISDKIFLKTMVNTLFYAIIQIPVMLLLALVIAIILNDPKLKFRGVYRTCIFVPCVTSMVSYAILFKNIFSMDGIVNQLLIRMGVVNHAIPFVSDAQWAKTVVIFALIWRYTGYYMIFFLAALQNIDGSIYEAARLDGCNFRQSLFNITLPVLRPIVFLTSVMALNSTIQLFDEVVNLTAGGPGDATRTVSEYIYDLSFTFVPNYGYSAAISFVVLVLVASLTMIQKGVTKEKV